MGGYDMTGMWGWGLGMMVFTPLLWVAIVALVAWVVARATRPERSEPASRPESGALRILEERMARGEIDVEEFRSRSAALASTR